MNPFALLDKLAQQGITLHPEGDKIRVTVFDIELTEAERNCIRENKVALLTLLRLSPDGKTTLEGITIPRDLDPWLSWADTRLKDLLGTPWLLPYRSLIEEALGGLLPSDPVPLSSGLILDDPARAVREAAQAINVVAVICRGRAATPHENNILFEHFSVLCAIETWKTTRLQEDHSLTGAHEDSPEGGNRWEVDHA